MFSPQKRSVDKSFIQQRLVRRGAGDWSAAHGPQDPGVFRTPDVYQSGSASIDLWSCGMMRDPRDPRDRSKLKIIAGRWEILMNRFFWSQTLKSSLEIAGSTQDFCQLPSKEARKRLGHKWIWCICNHAYVTYKNEDISSNLVFI